MHFAQMERWWRVAWPEKPAFRRTWTRYVIPALGFLFLVVGVVGVAIYLVVLLTSI